MENVYIVVVVTAGVVLLAAAFLLRDRLSRISFRFWQTSGDVETNHDRPVPEPKRRQFIFSRNKLKRGSRITAPESIGMNAESNRLTASSIEIRDSTRREAG